MAEVRFITQRQVISIETRAWPSTLTVLSSGFGLRGLSARSQASPAWSKMTSWGLLGSWKLLEGSTDSEKHPMWKTE